MTLQDPDLTKVILVTLAEPTPVLEAQKLQADLHRAGIHPWAWVINSSLAAARPTGDFLQQRAAAELTHIAAVRAGADRVAIVPLLTSEPVGEDRLLALTTTARNPRDATIPQAPPTRRTTAEEREPARVRPPAVAGSQT